MHATPHPSDVPSLRSLLQREHTKLDELFEQLLTAFGADASADTAKLWSAFDRELIAHLVLACAAAQAF